MSRIPSAHLEAMIAIDSDAIVSVDEHQRIVLFNRGAEATFGYSAREVIGQPLDILLPESARSVHHAHVERFGGGASAARLAGERATVQGRRKNGELFPAEASLIRTRINGASLFTAVMRDITERRRAEEERQALLNRERTARETAERATRLRDEVLGIVSHDLRSPTAAIAMAVTALELDPELTPQRRAELIKVMRDAIDWANRLIRDLLDVAAGESGRLSVDRQPDDFTTVLDRAESMFRPQCADANVQLTVETYQALPPVLMDAERIFQVLGNLLSNAVKFTPSGGRIELAARIRGDVVEVSVSDSGPGIPPDALPHIFEPFWHLKNSGRSRGTGLGLSIAAAIVAAHGGHIRVDTQLGAGSAFIFTLPVAPKNESSDDDYGVPELTGSLPVSEPRKARMSRT